MGNPDKAGPSQGWFILPCILVLAAVFLAGLGISSFLHFAGTDFVAYQPGSSILVTSNGFTLYTEEGTTGAVGLRCTATGPQATVQLPPIAGRTILDNGQGTFVAIASTPQDLPPGRYVISCVSTSGVADIPLFLGPRLDLAAVARLIAFNILAPALLAFWSVALFVILAILRYRSSRIDTQTV